MWVRWFDGRVRSTSPTIRPEAARIPTIIATVRTRTVRPERKPPIEVFPELQEDAKP